jgi:hypothetical protein
MHLIPIAENRLFSQPYGKAHLYFAVTVAVLMGDKYSKNQQRIEDMVEHFTSFIHLIFQESARLSLIPASVAAFLKISAWRNFVSAVDEALAVGKNFNSFIHFCTDMFSTGIYLFIFSICGTRNPFINVKQK